jgi:inhibitor of KinA
MGEIEIIPYGEQAVLVNLEQAIRLDIVEKVYFLQHNISNCDYVIYTIPAYCSLVIGYKPAITLNEVTKDIHHFLTLFTKDLIPKGRYFEVPVCYELAYGLDLTQVSIDLNISIDQIISMHCEHIYSVYMIGFLPGFPYLGELSDSLVLPRKLQPMPLVPGGSVAIAGNQTGIYPQDSPGGWHILGRTPISLIREDGKNLFQPCDKIKFFPIDEKTYLEWKD